MQGSYGGAGEDAPTSSAPILGGLAGKMPKSVANGVGELQARYRRRAATGSASFDATKWRQAGIDRRGEMDAYESAGIYDPKEALELQRNGVPGGLAAEYAGEGVTGVSRMLLRREAQRFILAGVTEPEEAQAWRRAGFDGLTVGSWRGEGFNPTDAEMWRDYRFSPSEARKYVAAGVDYPRHAAALRRDGVDGNKAINLAEGGDLEALYDGYLNELWGGE